MKDDAISCWNKLVEANIKPGRLTLQRAIQEAGFECGENKARDFLKEIKEMLENPEQQQVDR